MSKARKLVILDRDGVINYDSPYYIKTPQEWQPIPGSLEAIALLKQADYTVVIATNQSGLARGLYDEQLLTAIHEKMLKACQEFGGTIDRIYYCPHHPDEHCFCRKPKPGMLIKIAEDFCYPLSDTCVIGDRLSDIRAAQSVEANPLLVKTGYKAFTPDEESEIRNIPVFDNLLQATKAMLKC